MTEEIEVLKLESLSLKNNFNNIQHLIFIFIISCLFVLFKIDYYLFHSTAEIYSCVIAGAILCIALSTYQMTRNNYFLFLGIGYMFILVLDLFHTISYGELFYISESFFDLDTKFWVAARGMELVTLLISFVFLFKPNKKYNFFIIFLLYFTITLILTLDIFEYRTIIPTMRIQGSGITKFKIYFEYLVAIGFSLCCFLLFMSKEKIDKNLFLFLEISLICKVISKLF